MGVSNQRKLLGHTGSILAAPRGTRRGACLLWLQGLDEGVWNMRDGMRSLVAVVAGQRDLPLSWRAGQVTQR
jgi:hypothetical protein